jgi:hypothetical protein
MDRCSKTLWRLDFGSRIKDLNTSVKIYASPLSTSAGSGGGCRQDKVNGIKRGRKVSRPKASRWVASLAWERMQEKNASSQCKPETVKGYDSRKRMD